MTTPTPDPAVVQAIARALSDHALRRCAQCGQIETTTTDGRRRHEQLYGHALSGAQKREEDR